MLRIVLSILIIFSSGFLSGQIDVSVRLEPEEILIGDQVQLQLVIEHEVGVFVESVGWSALDTLSRIEVLSEGRLDTISRRKGFLLNQVLILTSFDSGYHLIPEIPVAYRYQNSRKLVRSNPLALEVNTIPVTADSIHLAPIKTIMKEPLKFRDVWPYMLGVLMLGALIFAIITIIKRKKQKGLTEAPPPIIPPHQVALDRIEQLRNQKLWQQGKIKQFQSELTHIIREYLEHRFRIRALESTTEETLKKVKTLDIEGHWNQKLRNMFQIADLVKFAKANPPADFHSQVLYDAEAFVLESKPKPVTEDESIEKEEQ